MDDGGSLAPALRASFGLGPGAFTSQWRSLLSDLAGEGS
jgi:hypothetical protein